MTESLQQIPELLKERIEAFQAPLEAVSVGTVIGIGDGVARVDGLSDVMMNELVAFPNEVIGIALSLEQSRVIVVVLGDHSRVQEGDVVRSTGQIVSVPTGDTLLGRVVNALGAPVDGSGPVAGDCARPVERMAPGIVERAPVDSPLQTGIKAIDSMIPIGRGQRELIIGDRGTGKTAVAIDTIINQRDQNVICIYVAIGQRLSSIARVVATLRERDALKYTIVVSAPSSDPASMQYLAPYAGCAMGEAFMEMGRDVLIVYDDLSKHAWAYRELSLLLRRPPGREAYPGDIFYLQSRLLERAGKLNAERGGGTMTALPIVETQQGDIAAYIPTNAISITDGQIYLEGDLFHAAIRPAVNVGLSVSRVGGKAQTEAMRRVAGKLRLDLIQFRDLAAFAQFGTDLDRATRESLDRGNRIIEVLKQDQYEPMPVGQQVMIIYVVINGFVDEIPIEEIRRWERQYHEFMNLKHPEVGQMIATTKRLTPGTEQSLRRAISEYQRLFEGERNSTGARP